MNGGSVSRRWAVLLTAAAVFPAPAMAADWEISGSLREEIAIPDGAAANPNNQAGNPFNGVREPNLGLGPLLAPGLSPNYLERPGSLSDYAPLNMLATRLEVNLDGKISDEWAVHIKLRAFGDLAGTSDTALQGANLFKQPFYAAGGGTPLEVASKKWMLDAPAAYIDYNNGPIWIRLGNQQIAWGEAIFFRVLDVDDGIDFRRHSILDVAAEEYSDKRVPAPGVRASYRFSDTFQAEAFAQLAEPSIPANPGSPYNFIPDQFSIDSKDGFDKVRGDVDFGAKAHATFGDADVQLMAVHRVNPDGVLAWTNSYAGKLTGTPYTAGTGLGVYSAQEWFNYASFAGLDGIGGLAASVNEFPATLGLGTLPVAEGCGATVKGMKISFPTKKSAACMLDTFFDPVIGLGNLVGNLARTYPQENVFGVSANYTFDGPPEYFLDQLIGRFELTYTPNKTFTSPTLSQEFVKRNEINFAFILEKYQKFFADFPATYIVLQWQHKTESDIFGRLLDGLNSTPGYAPKGVHGGWNGLILAIQQPSPTLAYRYDLTVLTDIRGGWLVQPGVKWKPSKSFQLDLYANIIKSGSNNGNFAETLNSANEVFLRGTYYF